MVTKKYRYAAISKQQNEKVMIYHLQVNYYKMMDALFGYQNNKSF